MARTPRRAAKSFWRSDQAKDHADMRLTCGSHVVGCVWWHLQLLFAARGLPKTSSEPRRGRGIVFRNSRSSLSAGRRACEPAAKPAIPGVILLHNGFVWPERTLFYYALAVETRYPRVAVAVVPTIRTFFFVETPRSS